MPKRTLYIKDEPNQLLDYFKDNHLNISAIIEDALTDLPLIPYLELKKSKLQKEMEKINILLEERKTQLTYLWASLKEEQREIMSTWTIGKQKLNFIYRSKDWDMTYFDFIDLVRIYGKN
jgi:hypothetical protein